MVRKWKRQNCDIENITFLFEETFLTYLIFHVYCLNCFQMLSEITYLRVLHKYVSITVSYGLFSLLVGAVGVAVIHLMIIRSKVSIGVTDAMITATMMWMLSVPPISVCIIEGIPLLVAIPLIISVIPY